MHTILKGILKKDILEKKSILMKTVRGVAFWKCAKNGAWKSEKIVLKKRLFVFQNDINGFGNGITFPKSVVLQILEKKLN